MKQCAKRADDRVSDYFVHYRPDLPTNQPDWVDLFESIHHFFLQN